LPVARSSGPVTPKPSSVCSSTAATPRRRWSTIWFLSISASNWSSRFGKSLQNARTRSSKPTGMSSITPPTWK
jgi:hypothetical protein